MKKSKPSEFKYGEMTFKKGDLKFGRTSTGKLYKYYMTELWLGGEFKGYCGEYSALYYAFTKKENSAYASTLQSYANLF